MARRDLIWLGCVLSALAVPAAAVEIDGHIGVDEWAGARHITDFRKAQPLTGEPGSLATEAWVLATPEGLAVAFRNEQPPGVPRTPISSGRNASWHAKGRPSTQRLRTMR